MPLLYGSITVFFAVMRYNIEKMKSVLTIYKDGMFHICDASLQFLAWICVISFSGMSLKNKTNLRRMTPPPIMKWIYNQLSTDSSSSLPPLSLALLFNFLLFGPSFLYPRLPLSSFLSLSLLPYMSLAPSVPWAHCF